jgi:ABC-type nitrate/sulfonate/bicarbonate transport system substrate-binding protein
MFGTPKCIRRIVADALIAGAVIASTTLLRPSFSRALDNVTLITDFGYNGRHAYFFDALEKGYYRDAGLEVKIVRGQGSMDAIRQVGAGNAIFGFADAGSHIGARQRADSGQAGHHRLCQAAPGDLLSRRLRREKARGPRGQRDR